MGGQMSTPEFDPLSEEFQPPIPVPSKSFERYDLTGNRIRKWTIATRRALVSTMRRIFRFGKAASQTQLPGSDEELGDKVKNIPGKGVEFLEAQIEKTPIENQLKAAQSQTEYLKQELLREQIANMREDTRGKKLNNATRELEIRERLHEIIQGKTGIHSITDGEKEIVVIGSIPTLNELNSDDNCDPITRLGLSNRTTNCLTASGVVSVADLLALGRSRMLSLHGIGLKAIAEIEEALRLRGLDLTD